MEEVESPSLRAFLGARPGEARATSALARVEVVRGVQPLGAAALARAKELISRTDAIPMTTDLLDEAAGLGPQVLRSMDAIHLASAMRLGPDLTLLIAYDRRLLEAATSLGMATAAPQ